MKSWMLAVSCLPVRAQMVVSAIYRDMFFDDGAESLADFSKVAQLPAFRSRLLEKLACMPPVPIKAPSGLQCQFTETPAISHRCVPAVAGYPDLVSTLAPLKDLKLPPTGGNSALDTFHVQATPGRRPDALPRYRGQMRWQRRR